MSFIISVREIIGKTAQRPDAVPVAAVAVAIPASAGLAAALQKVQLVQPRTLALAFAPSLASFAFPVSASSPAAIPSFAAISFAFAPAVAPIALANPASLQGGVCCRAICLAMALPVTTVALVSTELPCHLAHGLKDSLVRYGRRRHTHGTCHCLPASPCPFPCRPRRTRPNEPDRDSPAVTFVHLRSVMAQQDLDRAPMAKTPIGSSLGL